ncbi:MAG: 6-phosphofructokinase [Chloroflexi bacterium]|nr:6-phosphofructokinase [Chloroflexota bacterium]
MKLLVGQSGGPTAVINASLFGVLDEALASSQVSGVVGSLHGIEGVLRRELIDLGQEAPETLALLPHTPSAALGSCRYKLRDDDLEAVLAVFRQYDIRCFIYIGGNDSADTAHRVGEAAHEAGYELRVMGVPKTIDNDLPLTDHCPGYGSAARFVALATMAAGRDTEAMRRTDPVKIVEVMGRHAGWLAAASMLGKRSAEDAPHLVYVPERPLAAEAILDEVARAHQALGYAVLALCENQPDPSGKVLGAEGTPVFVDAFGHAYHESPGAYLARRIQDELGLRARLDKPGSIQRMMTATVSATDRAEAELVGRQAVRCALAGQTDQMVILVRQPGEPYACTLDTALLQDIANQQKRLPASYLEPQASLPSQAFRDYALPLIGEPLPTLARLRAIPV